MKSLVALSAVSAVMFASVALAQSSTTTWSNGKTTSTTFENGTATFTGPNGGTATGSSDVTKNDDGTRTRNTTITGSGGKSFGRSATRGNGSATINRARGGTTTRSR